MVEDSVIGINENTSTGSSVLKHFTKLHRCNFGENYRQSRLFICGCTYNIK